MKSKIILLISLLVYVNVFSQKVPQQKPNAYQNEKRQGEWVKWYNAKFEPTDILDSVVYYRKIAFRMEYLQEQ